MGIASSIFAKQSLLAEKSTSVSDAEVMVTIALPAGHVLTGKAIITLEDISVQDAASVKLASISIPASTLIDDQYTVAVPIDLGLVKPDTSVNVAVHIDSDNNGLLSEGDWISDSIVNAINNNVMSVTVDVVQIGS